MHPPRPIPSKNWWKVNATTSGLMVFGLSDAPKDNPITTECTIIPSSNTCNGKFIYIRYPCKLPVTSMITAFASLNENSVRARLSKSKLVEAQLLKIQYFTLIFFFF
ncbi:hypothetical protein HanIR_Chr04g0199951 [Helianthus annuus]|nr:hypothetical protein HanIR_Chr04g0199951 [Helianthus annuus]